MPDVALVVVDANWRELRFCIFECKVSDELVHRKEPVVKEQRHLGNRVNSSVAIHDFSKRIASSSIAGIIDSD